MKYNRSEIMSRAHQIRKEGKQLSEALTQAWTEAKIENINSDLFMLNMINRQSLTVKEQVKALISKRHELKNSLPVDKKAEEMAKAIAEKEQAVYQELQEIQWELGRIIRSKNPDRTFYQQLRARQAELKVA